MSAKKEDIDQFLKNFKKQQPPRIQSQPKRIGPAQQQQQILKAQPQIIIDENPSVAFEIFKDFTVWFPLFNITLTKKRIDVLDNLIKKQGGYSYITDYFFLGTFLQKVNEKKALIIVPSDVTEQALQNVIINKGLEIQNIRNIILKSEFITDCITHRKLLDYQNYCLYKQNTQITPPQSPHSGRSFDDDAEYNRNIQQTFEDETLYNKRLIKQQKAAKILMEKHRWMLDYDYDNHSDEEEIDHEQEMKLELGTVPPMILDDDISIIEKPHPEESLLEGIQVMNDVENPLKVQIGNFHNVRKQRFWETKKNHFICNTVQTKVNHNEHLTSHFERLLHCYENDRDKGRSIAYRRAITFLKSLQFKVKSVDDIMEFPTIGSKIKCKIKEILASGTLRKADNMQLMPKNQAQELFSSVWGIGPQTALMLYYKGIKTLDDLRKNQHLLNKNQQIGLKYVDELKIRIPREECTQMIDIIKKVIDRIGKGEYEAIACGSYRRGKQDCGDIDVLISRPDGKPSPGFLNLIVEEQTIINIDRLENVLLTDHLVLPKMGSHGSESYMGIGQLSKNLPHRRIDLKYYPREQFGYAVLYFTGSDHFNRSMRLFAQKKGYSLSDHGLYPVIRAHKNEKVWKGDLIPCYTELEVFQRLNVPYKTPEERSV